MRGHAEKRSTHVPEQKKTFMVEMPGLYFVIANADRARFVRPDPTNNPHTIRIIDASPLPNHSADAFAEALARIIDEEFAVDLFTDLVLVAPSAVLRALTAAIEAPTRTCLLGSLTADLVSVPDGQLRPFLTMWLPKSDGWLPKSDGWLPKSDGWLPKDDGWLPNSDGQ